jgi:hypothetical protein
MWIRNSRRSSVSANTSPAFPLAQFSGTESLATEGGWPILTQEQIRVAHLCAVCKGGLTRRSALPSRPLIQSKIPISPYAYRRVATQFIFALVKQNSSAASSVPSVVHSSLVTFVSFVVKLFPPLPLSTPFFAKFPATHSPHAQFSFVLVACSPTQICHTKIKGTCAPMVADVLAPFLLFDKLVAHPAASSTHKARPSPRACPLFPRFCFYTPWNQRFANTQNPKLLIPEILPRHQGGRGIPGRD